MKLDYSQKADDSIQKIVTTNYIDRRKNVRINYPPIGSVGGLPVVSIDNRPLKVANISTGGLCLIIEENDNLGQTIGDKHVFSLSWSSQRHDVTSQIVGINLDRRHIQFLDLPPQALVKIQLLLKPGFLGTKFRKVHLDRSRMESDAQEIWISPTGDNLNIYDIKANSHPVADFLYNNINVNIHNERLPEYKEKTNSHHQGQPVSSQVLNELIICIANFKDPSENLLIILENLNKMARRERS